MPTWDSKTKSFKGRVRITGKPQTVRTGFVDKETARIWEKETKAAFRSGKENFEALNNFKRNLFNRHPKIGAIPYYFELKAKYENFLENKMNTLPDLIDMMFSDFCLRYSYKDIKQIVENRARLKIPANIRLEILKRDGQKCQICGATSETSTLHIDHIVPVDRGGVTEERNLQVLCESCNYGKRDLPFHVAM